MGSKWRFYLADDDHLYRRPQLRPYAERRKLLAQQILDFCDEHQELLAKAESEDQIIDKLVYFVAFVDFCVSFCHSLIIFSIQTRVYLVSVLLFLLVELYQYIICYA